MPANCGSRFATMGKDSKPGNPKDSGSWAWKNESPSWAAYSESVRGWARALLYPPSSRSQTQLIMAPLKPIRILLADDHNVIRKGLRLLLESQPGFTVVAEAANGQQAVELAAETRPDVAVLDISMPRLAGTDAAERITELLPATGVVILSVHSDEGYVMRSLKAGAKGYLLKDSAESDLVEAIRAVSEGKAFFSPEISRMLAEDYVRQIRARGVTDTYELLTAREREILHLLAEGKSNKDIASLLNLSLYTVETHRRNLQEKLNLRSLAELILYAVRKGVIS